ncbi:hypothetical protein [Actinomadura sp. KC345]|uniref:hypothetical protein n=1 Tax=Actinomadura sp. KC345 TaxID=2530371 RepID=UPI001A9EE53C|nr:hypothetical protein [Actinomadura sp. KC345]
MLAGLSVGTAGLLLFHRAVPNGVGRVGSLLETFLPWLGLAVVVLLVSALLRRSATASVALLLPVAAWTYVFGGLLLPAPEPGPRDLVVVQHNVSDENTWIGTGLNVKRNLLISGMIVGLVGYACAAVLVVLRVADASDRGSVVDSGRTTSSPGPRRTDLPDPSVALSTAEGQALGPRVEKGGIGPIQGHWQARASAEASFQVKADGSFSGGVVPNICTGLAQRHQNGYLLLKSCSDGLASWAITSLVRRDKDGKDVVVWKGLGEFLRQCYDRPKSFC